MRRRFLQESRTHLELLGSEDYGEREAKPAQRKRGFEATYGTLREPICHLEPRLSTSVSTANLKMILSKIDENLKRIRVRIAAAAGRADRNPESVTLVAVTKYAEPAWVQALFDLGHRDFGENRPQQLARRAGEFPSEIHWHLIGHLQRNKVGLVLPATTRIHSVDSLRLLKRIGESSLKAGATRSVLLEVNVSGEAAKDGLSPSELRELWPQFCEQSGVQIDGLMTMAPHTDDPESTRATFRGLRALRDQLAESSQGEQPLPELSMGMSGDFEVAIEEGATLIRVGSSLYEGLSPP